jgi:Kef-type K+ transport system membrane component KefB
VLGVAVLEDVLLYILLSIALALAAGDGGQVFGLPSLLGIATGTPASVVASVAGTVGFLAVTLSVGPALSRALFRALPRLDARGTIAFELLFLIAVTLLGMFVGVIPMLGAFAAGILTTAARVPNTSADPDQVRSFGLAFFIPLYFAMVGMRLDLIHHFDPLWFLGFLAFACAVKWCSIYGAARLAHESPRSAANLAAAMNARGGPASCWRWWRSTPESSTSASTPPSSCSRSSLPSWPGAGSCAS